MAVKRRLDKRREDISEDAQRWLHGETPNGFFQFKPLAERREFWERYGDKENYEWPEGDRLPRRKL